jgi:hypothetical protein
VTEAAPKQQDSKLICTGRKDPDPEELTNRETLTPLTHASSPFVSSQWARKGELQPAGPGSQPRALVIKNADNLHFRRS